MDYTKKEIEHIHGIKIKKTMRKAININWDTDGEVVDLPSEVILPDEIGNCGAECGCKDWKECDSAIADINNYLSDTYG